MMVEITAAERRRYAETHRRIAECINDLIDEGFSSAEIYTEMAEVLANGLIQEVPEIEKRSVFVQIFRERTIRHDA